MEKIAVVVIDNNLPFRRGLRQSLSRRDDIQILAESNVNDKAVTLVKDLHPDIVLLDINPATYCLARQLTFQAQWISIIALAEYDSDELLFQATKIGAASYLTKDRTAEEVASEIKKIYHGQRVIKELVLARPRIAEKLVLEFQKLSMMSVAIEKVAPPLSSRELEILEYVARGYINKQIAQQFAISSQTVKNHMSSILRKLNAKDRTEATVLAIEHGWIIIGDGYGV